MPRNKSNTMQLKGIRKQMRKLERKFEKVPEQCVLVRDRMVREMGSLTAREKMLTL